METDERARALTDLSLSRRSFLAAVAAAPMLSATDPALDIMGEVMRAAGTRPLVRAVEVDAVADGKWHEYDRISTTAVKLQTFKYKIDPQPVFSTSAGTVAFKLALRTTIVSINPGGWECWWIAIKEYYYTNDQYTKRRFATIPRDDHPRELTPPVSQECDGTVTQKVGAGGRVKIDTLSKQYRRIVGTDIIKMDPNAKANQEWLDPFYINFPVFYKPKLSIYSGAYYYGNQRRPAPGYYEVVPKSDTALALAVSPASQKSGADCAFAERSGAASQRWALTSRAAPDGAASGYYYSFTPACALTCGLSCTNYKSGGQAQIYKNHGEMQVLQFERQDDGTWAAFSVKGDGTNSKLALTCKSGGKAVFQKWTGADSQRVWMKQLDEVYLDAEAAASYKQALKDEVLTSGCKMTLKIGSTSYGTFAPDTYVSDGCAQDSTLSGGKSGSMKTGAFLSPTHGSYTLKQGAPPSRHVFRGPSSLKFALHDKTNQIRVVFQPDAPTAVHFMLLKRDGTSTEVLRRGAEIGSTLAGTDEAFDEASAAVLAAAGPGLPPSAVEGWYKGEMWSGEDVFSGKPFASGKVSGPIWLWARVNEGTVEYYADGELVHTEVGLPAGTAVEPSDEAREKAKRPGCTPGWRGWFTDEGCETAFTSATVPEGTYRLWSYNELTVDFRQTDDSEAKRGAFRTEPDDGAAEAELVPQPVRARYRQALSLSVPAPCFGRVGSRRWRTYRAEAYFGTPEGAGAPATGLVPESDTVLYVRWRAGAAEGVEATLVS